MLRNLACDFIISCLIDFLNLTQMIVCMYMVAVIVLDILELIIKLLDLCNVLTNSLVEGSDISGTTIVLNYALNVTELIKAVQCLDLHMKLIYPMINEL